MGRAAILSPHLGDAATLTVDSEVATLPGTFLQTMEAWQLWRADANTAAITLDFGSTVSLSAGAFIGLNATATATWRWRYAANLAGLASPTTLIDWTEIDTSGPPDAALFPNRRSFVKFNAITCGALSIEIEDYDNAEVLQAWRLMVGSLFQPAAGIDPELARPIDSADAQEARFSGGRATGARGRTRGATFQWSNLTRAETDTLQDLAMLRGNWGDVLFLLDPDDTDRLQRDSVLGPFTPGYPDIADIAQWPGDGLDLQMSRAAVRIMEGNAA